MTSLSNMDIYFQWLIIDPKIFSLMVVPGTGVTLK